MFPHGGIRRFIVVPDRLLLMTPGAGQLAAAAVEPPDEPEPHATAADAVVTAITAVIAMRRVERFTRFAMNPPEIGRAPKGALMP